MEGSLILIDQWFPVLGCIDSLSTRNPFLGIISGLVDPRFPERGTGIVVLVVDHAHHRRTDCDASLVERNNKVNAKRK
jgi:hypothetical protein